MFYQIVFILFVSFSQKGYTLVGEHICYNEETYTELEQQKTTQPVKVRSYNWCFSFPPRCSNYRTEIKEVIKLQNVTKTRLTEHCCDGFVENLKPLENTTICTPICRGGCRHGFCELPNQCNCDIGYQGVHCTQRCKPKMFGKNCKNICKCRNGSLCDHKSGFCRCTPGWIGDFCEKQCPKGKYGVMCQSTCQCGANKCNPETGDCIAENHQILFDWPGNKSANVVKLPSDRIKVNHWIQVNSNGKLNMKNCSLLENCDDESTTVEAESTTVDITELPINQKAEENLVHLIGKTHQHHVQVQKNNTIMMNSLNSSIANLTNDVGKLSKQVSDQHDDLKKVINSDTYLPKMAILLDSSPVIAQPNIEQSELLSSKIQDTNLMSLAAVTQDAQVHSMSSLNQQHLEQVPAEQLSIIETRATIQHSVMQGDANGNDDGVTQTNSIQNEIFQLFNTIEDRLQDNNATMVDRQHRQESTKTVSHIILGLIILIVLSLIGFGLIYGARRKKTLRQSRSCGEVNIDMNEQISQKPLPEIPSFTHSITRRIIAQQEIYDSPPNNHSVRENLNKLGNIYNNDCRNEPIYARSRKQSAEHIYDEINYVGNTATKR